MMDIIANIFGEQDALCTQAAHTRFECTCLKVGWQTRKPFIHLLTETYSPACGLSIYVVTTSMRILNGITSF